MANRTVELTMQNEEFWVSPTCGLVRGDPLGSSGQAPKAAPGPGR